MHEAYLVGISRYPDHTLQSVPNDLALLAQALEHRGYPSSAIHVFNDTHTTRAALLQLFSDISRRYADVEDGSCYLHIGASGMLSSTPLAGGMLPSDGNLLDWNTAVPFAALNAYLPLREGVNVMLTIET